MPRKAKLNQLWRILCSISMISRLVVLGISFISLLFLDEVVLLVEKPFILAITLGLESLVFINSIVPLGILSIISAHYLIHEQAWLWVFAGYLSGLIANIASYSLGRYLATSKYNTYPDKTSFLITFWNPQLASLAAFNEGLRQEKLPKYLYRSLLFSAVWFSVVCIIIAQTPASSDGGNLVLIAVLALIIWIIYDILKGLFKPIT